ncbi:MULTISPECIES: hypothetical protein [Amycolatopsis]|uniref:hypothetical protein n=1 Tax=Amycolatopsis TaxID=1813 RepID=UPI001E51CC2B|nr:hypothetical protein [Amycolatopsis bullii]
MNAAITSSRRAAGSAGASGGSRPASSEISGQAARQQRALVREVAVGRGTGDPGRFGGREVGVDLPAGAVPWVAAQEHAGENVGATPTHAMFVELKESRPGGAVAGAALGPGTP